MKVLKNKKQLKLSVRKYFIEDDYWHSVFYVVGGNPSFKKCNVLVKIYFLECRLNEN